MPESKGTCPIPHKTRDQVSTCRPTFSKSLPRPRTHSADISADIPCFVSLYVAQSILCLRCRYGCWSARWLVGQWCISTPRKVVAPLHSSRRKSAADICAAKRNVHFICLYFDNGENKVIIATMGFENQNQIRFCVWISWTWHYFYMYWLPWNVACNQYTLR